jgi:ligand-binding sensor domain-containing protein
MTNLLKLSYLFLATWLFLIYSAITQAADFTFTPVAPVVEIGEKITLTVSGTTGQVTWSAQKGWIIGVGNEVTYQAPDQAGFDVVLVSDAAGNIGTVKIQVVAKSNISPENAVWEVFTNRSNIRALLLSEDGKTLWVGTEGGLEKRDAQAGEIQQVFINTDGLPGNSVSALLNDNQGGLWVGTSRGLAHYTAHGQWQVFDTNNSGLPDNGVSTLLNDNQGGLWVGTYEGGLAHYTAQGLWEMFNQDNSGLPSNQVEALLSDNRGGLWVGTSSYYDNEKQEVVRGGLAHYTSQEQWQVFESDDSDLSDNSVYTLLSDNQSGLWVGTYNGLVHYTDQNQWQVDDPDGYEVYALLSDSQGGLWVGTGGGLAHYTAQGQWQVFNQDNFDLSYIPVAALSSDGQGGVWVGTYNRLAHYTAQGQWQMFKQDSSSLPNNWVITLLSDSQGGLWMGTDGGGLAHYTAQGQWQVFNQDNSDLPDDSVYALLSDGQSGLWVGTGEGLAHYTTQGQWQAFNLENSGLPDNWVRALLSDSQDGLWVGTDRGLAHYNAHEQWQVFNQDNSDLPDNSINVLLSDNQGGLWIGTYNGLARYNAQEQWQGFKQDSSSLPDNWISALLSDGQGGLWVGNYCVGACLKRGLTHYTAWGKGQWFNTNNSGLSDNNVTALLSDNQDGLWVGTERGGLAHYTVQKQWQVFNRDNSGLPDNEVTALLNDSQGGLWVGTWGGGLAHLTFPEKQTGNRAAILIASGGNDTTNSLWETTESITTYLYKMLAARKFVNEEIYYLSSKDWADFNGDSFNDRIVDAPRPERPLVLDDLRQVFTWAKGRGKLDQPLYVFFIDHGDTEKLKLSNSEYIEATDLKAILDDYQTATGNQLVLVIEACYSGSLLPVLKAPNRAIITSASANEVALFDYDKQGFTRFLTKYLYNNASFLEAFQLAQRDQNDMLGKNFLQRTVAAGGETVKTMQLPQLDDNGDGIYRSPQEGAYDPTQDGQWLERVIINSEPMKVNSSPPAKLMMVNSLTTATTLSVGQSLKLQARTVDGPAARVWAVIRPPRMNRVIDTSGTPILAFPRENLYSTKEKDTWEGTWKNAVYNGEYEITFYAKDEQGNIAGSEPSVIITVTGGVEPPPQATVTFQLEKDRYQRGEVFKATVKEDLGYGYDLYIGVQLPDGQILTMKDLNQFAPLNPPAKWWSGRPRPQSASLNLLDLPLPQDLPVGKYCLYGVLSPAGNDVFEARDKGLWVMSSQCFEVF